MDIAIYPIPLYKVYMADYEGPCQGALLWLCVHAFMVQGVDLVATVSR